MLKAKALTPTSSHEDLFLQRYEWLLGWALKLTDHDREQAEDLLHDAYIQFTFSKPDIQSIQNVEGYLYGMLRFMRLSQIRRTNRSSIRPPSIVEYDSAELSLRAFDPQAQIQMQDELTRVCHYACQRKETSKAGSVLILRFFHGYYPNEIAQILHCTRAAVSKWERIARAEAGLFIENPTALSFLQGQEKTTDKKIGYSRSAKDFLYEMREAVFRSRTHDCLPAEQMAGLFLPESNDSLDLQSLAHVVSCQACLDAINQTLDLPLLSERYPTDTLGKDMNAKGPKGGCGGNGDSSGGATGDGGKVSGWQRRCRQVFEHRPKELCISVNGYIQGSQKISSDVMEQSLLIDLSEPIGFVEIISEQGIRLLFHIVELPPAGPAEQRSHIELSDGRALDASLNFGGPWPKLQVVYTDPQFNELESSESESLSELSATLAVNEAAADGVLEAALPGHPSSELALPAPRSRVWTDSIASLRNWFAGLRLSHFDFGMLLRPGVVTSIVALILVGALLLLQSRKPGSVLTAADVLRKSAEAEDAIASRADMVLHRTITLEERVLSEPGAVATGSISPAVTRRRIEIWSSAEKGITARRLYDDKGALIAGDWRSADGVQTLYHHGSKPQLQLTPDRRPNTPSLNSDGIWQLSPSAKDFLAVVRIGSDSDRANDEPLGLKVEELGDLYIVSAKSAHVISGTLTLSKSDLHATELSVVIPNRQSAIGNRQFLEYHFAETSFERRPVTAVAPSVFEPDAILLSSTLSEIRNPKSENDKATAEPATPVIATADLEVEVMRLLHGADADLGEQIGVTRSSDGVIRVEGLVDTQQRKMEILKALAPVTHNPTVKIEVSTFAEAVALQARQKRATTSSGTPGVAEQVQTSTDVFPAYADLRQRFSDEEARRFATRMVDQSHQAMRHAWALKRLMQQFSAEDLRTLTTESRSKWLNLIRAHSTAFSRDTARLRKELSIVFSDGSTDSSPSVSIANDDDLLRAVERLIEVASANDQVIGGAFSISTESNGTSNFKTAQFFRSLNVAERLAQTISRVSQ